MEALQLYRCEVMHRRLGRHAYRFAYRTFSLLLDIDRLEQAGRHSRWFSIDRFNLLSFHRVDHLPPGEQDLRAWLQRVVAPFGLDLGGARIRLLCMPRVLGWGFDPLSVWYCEDPQGLPLGVLCEVHNTFGERHSYLLPGNTAWPLKTSHDKIFHVSPFLPVRGGYRFVLHRPQQQLRLTIRYHVEGETCLVASQRGERLPANDTQLLRQFLRVPLQSLKILSAIHWHVLRVWLRGAVFHRKPEPPLEEVS